MRPILIVKCGCTLPALAARRGDFEDWIRDAMGLLPEEAPVVAAFRGDPLPEPGAFGGVVVTGSAAMVSDREPWSEQTAAWLPRVLEAATPLLGICYGHQLMAHGLGGRVGPNPRGREIGTVDVELVPGARDDALLGVLPRRPRVHSTHVESVLELPRGARLLGANEADPHHAFALGELAWGVQFHPEFDADVMRGYLRGRADALREEGLDPEGLLAQVEESPHGRALLARFAQLVRSRG